MYYAAGARLLGFGYHKGTKSVMRWSQDFCEWLDSWTHYRTRKEIHLVYGKYLRDIKHIEDDWLQSRVGRNNRLVACLPTAIQKLLVLKLARMIFIAGRPIR
jgi:hypothetical protein